MIFYESWGCPSWSSLCFSRYGGPSWGKLLIESKKGGGGEGGGGLCDKINLFWGGGQGGGSKGFESHRGAPGSGVRIPQG